LQQTFDAFKVGASRHPTQQQDRDSGKGILRLSVSIRLIGSLELVSPTEEVEVTNMRIGIVNDLTLARVAMQRILVSSPHHEVAWMANDGGEAIARARRLRGRERISLT
jgi:hypothetical protein